MKQYRISVWFKDGFALHTQTANAQEANRTLMRLHNDGYQIMYEETVL